MCSGQYNAKLSAPKLVAMFPQFSGKIPTGLEVQIEVDLSDSRNVVHYIFLEDGNVVYSRSYPDGKNGIIANMFDEETVREHIHNLLEDALYQYSKSP